MYNQTFVLILTKCKEQPDASPCTDARSNQDDKPQVLRARVVLDMTDVVTFPSSPGAAFGTVAAAVCPWTRCSRARWLWRGPDWVGRRGGWNGPARCPRNLRRPRPSGRYRQCTIARGRYHKSSWRHPLDLATTKKTMLTLAAAAVDSSLVSSRRSRSRYLLHRPRSRLRSEK